MTNKKIVEKTSYIIFGASGDLSKRYLLPTLQKINFTGSIIPVSRKDYDNLKNLIQKEGIKIFHLAIPPEAVPQVIELISKNVGKNEKNGVKILLEKPFGKNLKSAQALVEHIDKYFSENQIYRVDHYLAKQSLQNVVTEKWDRGGIASIEIIASEKIDIEGRVHFYEQTGALKDFVQSHLIEMLAVVLSGSFETTRRHEVLKNLQIVCDISKHECVKRGQYEGYRKEVNNLNSMVETFVSINMISNDPIWRGVSIILSTGKAMNEKRTQIKVTYKNGGEKSFNIEHEPEAYKHVLSGAMQDDHRLFISSGEVLESWRILDAIEETWKGSADDLIIYPKGSKINEI